MSRQHEDYKEANEATQGTKLLDTTRLQPILPHGVPQAQTVPLPKQVIAPNILKEKICSSIEKLNSEFCLRFHLSSSLRRCLEYTRPINKKKVSLSITPNSVLTLSLGNDENVLLLTLEKSTWHFFQLPAKPLRLTFAYQEMYELLRSVNKERHRRVAEAKARAREKAKQERQQQQQAVNSSLEGEEWNDTQQSAMLTPNVAVLNTNISTTTPVKRPRNVKQSVAKTRAKAKAKARAKAKLKSMQNAGKTGKQEVPFYITLRDNRLFCALGFASGNTNRPPSKCTKWIELDSTSPLPSFDLTDYGGNAQLIATIRIPIKWFRKTIVDCGVAGSTVFLEVSANRFVIKSIVSPRCKIRREANSNGHLSRSDGCSIEMPDDRANTGGVSTGHKGKKLKRKSAEQEYELGSYWSNRAVIVHIEKFLRPCSASDYVTIVITKSHYLLLKVCSSIKGNAVCQSQYHMKMLDEWTQVFPHEPSPEEGPFYSPNTKPTKIARVD